MRLVIAFLALVHMAWPGKLALGFHARPTFMGLASPSLRLPSAHRPRPGRWLGMSAASKPEKPEKGRFT
jgi:hypothetical protein